MKIFSPRVASFARMEIDLPLRTWWTLWALLFASAWLLPAFSQLWPSFDLELLATACCLTLTGTIALKTRTSWLLPKSAVAICLLASVPLLQFAVGIIYFFGDAWMSFLYLGGLSICIITGARLADNVSWTDALFFAIATAAIVSVGIAFKQWMGVEGLHNWTRDLPPGSRPFANLAQPNNLATLICWGLLTIWRSYDRQKLGGFTALFAAIYLMAGLALTQSRAGWLILIGYSIAAVLYRRRLKTRNYAYWLFFLIIIFVVEVGSVDRLAGAIHYEPAQDFTERLQPGHRLAHWRSMWVAIEQRPWLGWGWNQVSVAQQSVAPGLPAVPELIGYSHSLLLDLLVWNGLPIGVAVIALLAFWTASTGRRLQSNDQVFLYLAVCALLTHGLVEFPYTYTFFLFPAGLMIGALSLSGSLPRWNLPNGAVVVVCAGALGLTGWTALEYFKARENFTTLRFERAHVGTSRNSPPPALLLLTQLRALATLDRMPIVERSSAEDLELARRTSERFPGQRTLMQYAAMAAGHGDTLSAQLALVRLCKLYPQEDCTLAETVWRAWGEDRYRWVKSVPFPKHD